MSTTLERIEKLEQTLEDLKKSTGMSTGTVQQLIGVYGQIMQKVSLLEQSISSLAKTLAAMSSVLVSSGTLQSDSVMDKIRDMDDKEQEAKVKAMLDAGNIKEEVVVSEGCLLAVIQNVIFTDSGKVKNVSNYSLFSIDNPAIDKEASKALLGKKVGDTVDFLSNTKDSTKKEVITIKAIFSFVDKEVTGEVSEETTELQDKEDSNEQEKTDK